MVMSSSVAGAEIITFFAPAVICFLASAALVKWPVDSRTTSAPTAAQGSSAGSRSAKILIVFPPTVMVSSVKVTGSPRRPRIESYFKRCAKVALSVRSLIPTISIFEVGSARRLGIVAKAREVRGVDRVVIRDGDAIGVLLTRLGAHESVLAWEERRMRREVRATANRLANFDDANLRRSARAAVAASARVQRAMEILSADIPDHLREAGELRIQHGQASLEELGSLASPPMTKDAIAGRIRRLLAMADKRAQDLGIPDTEAGLSPDLLG